MTAEAATPSFRGTYTALITPFTPDGALDTARLQALVERQIEAGVKGLVIAGTTGESPTLSVEEHLEVIRTVVDTAGGRVQVIAGTGANATPEALHLTREADALGVDALLQVAPYYNKPTQEGLYRHFAAVAEATDKPVMLYSIPGRCGVAIGVETVARLLRAHPNVNVIKEAGGDVSRVTALRLACGPGLTVLCGDDGLTLPFMAAGATGVVSVASNLAPGPVRALVEAAQAGDFTRARTLHEQLYPLLTTGVFLEGNPVTIKALMDLAVQLPSAALRLPLVTASAAGRAQLHALWEALQPVLEGLDHA